MFICSRTRATARGRAPAHRPRPLLAQWGAPSPACRLAGTEVIAPRDPHLCHWAQRLLPSPAHAPLGGRGGHADHHDGGVGQDLLQVLVVLALVQAVAQLLGRGGGNGRAAQRPGRPQTLLLLPRSVSSGEAGVCAQAPLPPHRLRLPSRTWEPPGWRPRLHLHLSLRGLEVRWDQTCQLASSLPTSHSLNPRGSRPSRGPDVTLLPESLLAAPCQLSTRPAPSTRGTGRPSSPSPLPGPLCPSGDPSPESQGAQGTCEHLLPRPRPHTLGRWVPGSCAPVSGSLSPSTRSPARPPAHLDGADVVQRVGHQRLQLGEPLRVLVPDELVDDV